MLSDSKKLSKGLIVYSVLVSDFEKLDFKNDALAGVRANFLTQISKHRQIRPKSRLRIKIIKFLTQWLTAYLCLGKYQEIISLFSL